MLARLLGIAISLSKSFILPISTPSPGCTCPASIITPMAAIIPCTTEEGMKSANPPSLKRPNKACRAPAQTKAASIYSQPSNAAIPAITMPISAGEGPLMDTLLLLIKDVKIPPTIAAIIPANRALVGKPMASAIPMDKGSATSETLKPASRSFLQYCLMSVSMVLIILAFS